MYNLRPSKQTHSFLKILHIVWIDVNNSHVHMTVLKTKNIQIIFFRKILKNVPII